MLLRRFSLFIRVILAFCMVVPTVTTAQAESAEKIRQEIFSLAENWNKNQESIIEYLNDPDPTRRMYAVDAIPLSDTKSAALKVVPLINDPNQEVRYRAINRFIDWSVEEAIPPLIDSLRSEDYKIKELAIMALVHQSHPSALNAIEEFVVKTEDDKWLEFVQRVLNSTGFGDPALNSRKEEITEIIKKKIFR